MLNLQGYTKKERDRLRSLAESRSRLYELPFIHHPVRVAEYLIDWKLDQDIIEAVLLLPEGNSDKTQITNILVEVNRLAVLDSLFAAPVKYTLSYQNMRALLLKEVDDVRALVIWITNRLWLITSMQAPERDIRLALSVYAPLADQLNMGAVKVLLEESAFARLDPDEYKKLRRKVTNMSTRLASSFDQSMEFIENTLQKANIRVVEFNKRRKNIYSVYNKLPKVGGDINEMYDLLAVRVIVPRVEDCYRALSILHEHTEPILHRIKDYIAMPKPNGYQSLHTTIELPSGSRIEVQIRTPAMHEAAETGVAAHFHYNLHKSSKHYQFGGSASALKPDIDTNIYAISPKGDVYALAEGSVALDFAFAVHTQIGLRTKALTVNGKIAKLDTLLSNGDVVTIITHKLPKPHRDWVKLVKTPKARNKIRGWFRLIEG